MSKIVVVIRSETLAPQVLMALHRATGLPLSAVRSAATTGAPLIEVELFSNDHDGVARTLRAIVDTASSTDVALDLFELGRDENFISVRRAERRIDSTTLENILSAWEDARET